MIFGLVLMKFASLYVMVHGLWCSECVGKCWHFPFEELGTACGCLELGAEVRGLGNGPKWNESPPFILGWGKHFILARCLKQRMLQGNINIITVPSPGTSL